MNLKMKERFGMAVAGLSMAVLASFVPLNTALANSSPEEGSEQSNLLAPHLDFINYLSCCTTRDARGNFEEEITGDPAFPYRIWRTHTNDGLELSEPVPYDVPARLIKNASSFEAHCANVRARDEAAGKVSTCIAPTFNVFWAYDNIKKQADGTFKGDGTKTYNEGDIVPVEEYRIVSEYCYWPQQNAF